MSLKDWFSARQEEFVRHTPGMARVPEQYDSPWKEGMERYLRPLLEFCFPHVGAAIDWESSPQFLDKELQEIVRDAALGEQRVDKLVRVRLRDGTEEWILVHVEVQHQPDAELALRVYQYHHRVRDRYGQRVLTLVILADERPDWRPGYYQEEILGCRVRFDFPVCKLLDMIELAREAAAKGQPSGVLILANWAAQQTRRDMEARLGVKWDLTRRLYEAGLGRKDILELYRLIDWLLGLPERLEQDFKQRVKAYEESKIMPYVTSIEKMAKEEGRAEGRNEGMAEMICRLARRRWPSLPHRTEEQIRALSMPRLENLAEAILDLGSPSDLETWLDRV